MFCLSVLKFSVQRALLAQVPIFIPFQDLVFFIAIFKALKSRSFRFDFKHFKFKVVANVFTLVAQPLALFRHGGAPRALLLLALAAPPRAQADPPPLARAHSTVAHILTYGAMY